MFTKGIATLAMFGAIGAILGYAQFRGLKLTVESYVHFGVRPRALGLHALRLIFVVGGLVAIAPFGAGPLLSALSGLLLMRTILLSPLRSQS